MLNYIIKIILIAVIIFGCSAKSQKPMFVATCQPVAYILQELVKTRGTVVTLLPAGASPHTYSPVPSDIQKTSAAKGLIYISENLDGWAANIPSKAKIELFKLLPQEYILTFDGEHHSHSEHPSADSTSDTTKAKERIKLANIDPHFWTDPMAVKALLPALVDTLSKLDSENADAYKVNAELFAKKLDLIDLQVRDIVKNIVGKPVFTFHPSFRYFLRRYNLGYAGSVEEAPGKEPSPRFVAEIVKKIHDSRTKGIFNEPQLPSGFINMIAQEAKVNVFLLDPIGGSNNISNYSDLILYNARILKMALE